jgi:glycosyltransferase involved in cell wall biosynthesis
MADRPRLLVAARSILPHMMGGYQRITWDVCRGLAARGWDVTVLTTPVPGRPSRFEWDGIQVATVAGARPQRIDWRWRRNATASARALGPFDAVLGAGPAGQAVRVPGAAEVYQCQDTFLHEVAMHGRDGRLRVPPSHRRPWVARYVARELAYIRRADTVLASAPSTAEALRRWPYGLLRNAREAVVVRNGVDPRRHRPDPRARAQWRARHGLRPDAPLVVTVCRQAPGKGVADALRAFRLFRRSQPAAWHVLVGAGPRQREAKRVAAALGLRNVAFFLGAQPDPETIRWLQAADLFLFLPWRAEVRPPLGLLEALACGLDVVASETALDPTLPHPRLHPVPTRRPDLAAAALEKAWRERRAGTRPDAPLPQELTIDACVRGHERVLLAALARRRRLAEDAPVDRQRLPGHVVPGGHERRRPRGVDLHGGEGAADVVAEGPEAAQAGRKPRRGGAVHRRANAQGLQHHERVALERAGRNGEDVGGA